MYELVLVVYAGLLFVYITVFVLIPGEDYEKESSRTLNFIVDQPIKIQIQQSYHRSQKLKLFNQIALNMKSLIYIISTAVTFLILSLQLELESRKI